LYIVELVVRVALLLWLHQWAVTVMVESNESLALTGVMKCSGTLASSMECTVEMEFNSGLAYRGVIRCREMQRRCSFISGQEQLLWNETATLL
jgi:hypothetical protein